MSLTACPHCGTRLPPLVDAFCPECRGELGEPPVNPVVPVGEEPASAAAARPAGPRLGRIFGWLGALIGIANGVLSLWSRDGGGGQTGHPDLPYLLGYVCTSAAILGVVGLVFGLVLEHFVRSTDGS